MSLAYAALLWLLAVQPPSDEDTIRALVQQYFDAQAQKDADKALSFWSAEAVPRPTREAFATVFGPGEDQYTVEIRRISISGTEARVRVAAVLVRTMIRNGAPVVARQTLLNAELWRKERATWKLLRDGPWAEDFADELLAAAAADRARLMAEHADELTPSLRYVFAQRASVAAVAQNYERARVLFELALDVARAAHDQRGESETLQNVGNAYYFQRDYVRAAEYYERRLTLAKEMADEEAVAAALLGLASASYARGEYTPALASYRDALAIYEKRDDGPSVGRTLVSVGNVQYLEAEYDAATASYKRALPLLIAGADPQAAGLARSGLARVLAAQGDLAAALDIYTQVLADAKARHAADPRINEVANALDSIGQVYFRLGNTDRARSAFDEARRLSSSDPDSVGRLSAELGLTELIAGRLDAALVAYLESRTQFEKAKNTEGVARAWVGIGFSQTERGKFTEAMAAYRTAIAMFGQQNEEENAGRAWLGLSRAQSGAGEDAAALESARMVKTIADRATSEDLVWRASVRAAEALRKLTRFDEARSAFQDAIAVIDRLAGDAPINPDALGHLDDSASAWTGLALTLAAQGNAAAAMDAAEARLAHIRRINLASFHREITRGETADEQAAEQGLVRDIISMRAQLRAEGGMKRPDAARLNALRQQLNALLARRADQQKLLYARLPDLERLRGLRFDPPDVHALLRDSDALVIEYVVSDDEVLLLAARRGQDGATIVSSTLAGGRHQLAEIISQVLQPAVLQDADEWRRRAAPLRTLLLAPIADLLRDRSRLVIVPDDLLWKIPFEALPDLDADLASHFNVTYATSLATLAVQRRLPPEEGSVRSAAIVAAPSIAPAVQAQLLLSAPGWKEPDSAATASAAQKIAGAYGDRAVVRIGADASESAVRTALQTVDVTEVAAPFHVSGASPLFSSVLLAGAGEQPESDGRWEVREWFGIDGRARVLIIPDASGFGGAGVGGAMDVLAWAAASAGVSAIVFGRWPGDVFSTDAVATGFHAQLAAGAAPADAWQAAVAAVRQKDTRPARWAGLRFIGG